VRAVQIVRPLSALEKIHKAKLAALAHVPHGEFGEPGPYVLKLAKRVADLDDVCVVEELVRAQ